MPKLRNPADFILVYFSMNVQGYKYAKIMKYVGVDSCRKGWFAVSIDANNRWNIEIFDSIFIVQ
jgi:hypothetical protein